MPLLSTRGAASARGFGFLGRVKAIADPFFNYVTMLLHGDGTNGGQNNTFLDASTNNFTITRNGNTTQGSFSPYGPNWSNYFDGSGDYLSIPDNTALEGFTDFTFECWLYVSDFASGDIAFAKGFGPGFCPYMFYFTDTDLEFYASSSLSSWDVAEAQKIVTNIVKNQWYHVAASRSGSTIRLFANGVLATSFTSGLTLGNNSGTFNVASAVDGTRNPEIYVSNLRINNTALYTAAFTPSTTPLTAVAGTQLLTCQSNRFRDNSTNAFTVSSFGTASVQRFSPFAPPAAYTTATIGGSGYFDGSGDYLNSPSITLSGNFTIEGWVNQTSLAQNGPQISVGNDISSSGTILLYLNTLGQLAWFINNSGGNGSTSVSPGTWNHVAMVRSGSTITMYLNGVSQGTDASSTTISGVVNIASTVYSSTRFFGAGYASNVRITTTAVYTGNFTPPTAPVTAITNTQLLLNFTNAAIFDNAMMNDLETVGNAQISTSVVKFGTGSMYFDGASPLDYIVGQVSPNLGFVTGNFTIEGWGYVTSTDSTYQCILSIGAPVQIYARSATIEVYFNDTDDTSTYIVNGMTGPASSVSANTWFHFAVVRNGTTFTAYVNGVAGTPVTGVSAQVALSATPLALGIYGPTTALPLTGYIDDFRITKGVARYTANFTPPTAAFPNL
jgi:Concanavalin A-like lectin/glucanases superfamily